MKKLIILPILILMSMIVISFLTNTMLNIKASDMGMLTSYNGYTSYRTYKEINDDLISKDAEYVTQIEELENLVISLEIPMNVSEEVLTVMSNNGKYAYYNVILDFGLILVIENNIENANENQKVLYDEALKNLENNYKSINIEDLNYAFGTNIDPSILEESVIVGITTFLENLSDENIMYFYENHELSSKKILVNSILEFSITSYDEKLTFYESLVDNNETTNNDASSVSLEDSNLDEEQIEEIYDLYLEQALSGVEIPSETEEVPTGESEIPTDETTPPIDNGETPPDEAVPPTDGGEIPPDGTNPPTDGEETPPDETEPPVDGGETPPDETEPPVDGGETPPDETEPPVDEVSPYSIQKW